MNSTILDCFANISAENEAERITSTIKLLRYLSQQDSQGENESKELNYALKRLIRSLGSSRALTRKSNYSTLIAFLSQNTNVTLATIWDIMEQELHPVSSNPKSETADIYFGRILTCGAMIRANILEKSTVDEQKKVLECLILAGKKRSYLSYCSTAFIVEYIDRINEEMFKSIWAVLEKEVLKQWNEQTTDTLYILMLTQDKFPSVINIRMKKILGSKCIIKEENIPHIFRVLTDIPRILCSEHPIYELFCGKLTAKNNLVVKFWEKMDEKFQKPSKTDENLAINILTHLLSNIKDKSVIPSLLSNNFLQYMLRKCTQNKKSNKDKIIASFKNILMNIATMLNEETASEVHIAVIKKLILCPGDLMVEKKLGIKIVNKIMANLNSEGVQKLAEIYRSIADNSTTKERHNICPEPWTNAERIYAAQLLIKLLGHPSMIEEDDWRLEQLKFFFESGFTESSAGAELAVQFKESFYRAIDQKLLKLVKVRLVFGSLILWLNDSLLEKKFTLRDPLDEAAQESWMKMIKHVKKLRGKPENVSAVFHTMYLHMGLQLFSEPEMAISSIDELNACYDKIKKKKSPSKKSSDDAVDEPQWVEVVVDLLLSLLSRKNHLLRSMVNCVFPHICPLLTAAAIHQILTIFDVHSGKEPLTLSSETDDESDESIAGSDSEDEKDEEEKNGVEEENIEEESDSDFEEAIEEDEENDGVTERLRMAVRQALGDTSILQTDQEGEDEIDVDQIDEVEGKRIDASLAAAFKMLRETRKSRSKKQGKSAETLMHFRTRVIDLLEIYLDHSPSVVLAIDMLVPLFLLLEFCIKDQHQKPLENRIRSCLKKLAKIKKFNDVENIDEQALLDILKMLMEKGERSASIYHEMGDKLAECCTFLVRCMQQREQTASSTDSIVQIYCENLKLYFKKRVLPASLFRNVLQLCWEGNWQIASLLVDFAFDCKVRSFSRSQALDFLVCFYRNNRLFQSTDEKIDKVREAIEKKLYENTISVLSELTVSQSTESSKKGKTDVKQNFLHLLFTLLREMHSKHVSNCWDWKEIAEKLAEYRSTGVSISNDTKTAYNKLAALVNPPVKVSSKKTTVVANGKPVKSEVDESQSEDESTSKPSKQEEKKKKKNLSKRKEKQMLKKQARELRDAAMAEGLENVNFTSASTFANGEQNEDKMQIDADSESDSDSNRLSLKRKTEASKSSPKKKKKKKVVNSG